MARMNGIVVHDIGPVKIEPAPVQPPSLQWLRSYSDWRRSWTHIVSGKFSASLYSGLLFYDPNDGVAEFYETDGQGGISLLRHYEDWRGSWTLIVAGTFGDSGFSGLLLYDQAAGFARFMILMDTAILSCSGNTMTGVPPGHRSSSDVLPTRAIPVFFSTMAAPATARPTPRTVTAV